MLADRLQNRLKKWTIVSTFVGGCSALAALIVFIYASAETYASSSWHYVDDMSTFGHFSQESWLCQMQHQWDGVGNEWWAPACREAVCL